MSILVGTYSGHLFDIENPSMETFDELDLAHHLSMECRFGGAVQYHYSVAQHSVLAAQEAQNRYPDEKRTFWAAALLHDGSEAYMKDVMSPLKKVLDKYKELEKGVQEWIYRFYEIPEEYWTDTRIKEIDDELYYSESRALMRVNANSKEWDPNWGTTIKIIPWGQQYAKTQFLRKLDELCWYSKAGHTWPVPF